MWPVVFVQMIITVALTLSTFKQQLTDTLSTWSNSLFELEIISKLCKKRPIKKDKKTNEAVKSVKRHDVPETHRPPEYQLVLHEVTDTNQFLF